MKSEFEYIRIPLLKKSVHKICSTIANNSSILTPLDGDPVGATVGLEEGETDGPFDGDNEGPLVGSEVIGEREGEVVG